MFLAATEISFYTKPMICLGFKEATMCFILDVNCYADYLNPNNVDMAPLKKWVEGKSKIAYSPTTRMEKELRKHGRMFELMGRYRTSNRVMKIDLKAVKAKEKYLKKCTDLISDDPHIIALALVANVKLLVSKDQKLGRDFTNKSIVGGKIYKKHKTHKALLSPKHACQ